MATGLATAAGAAQGARDAAAEARIAFWTSGYTGAELGSCEPPPVPALSRSQADMRAIGRAINTWQRCHGALVERLRAEASLEDRVEPAVLAAMNPSEREAAQRHIDAVHDHLLRTVEAEAAAAVAWHRDWLAATSAYVAAEKAEQRPDLPSDGANAKPAGRAPGRNGQVGQD